MEMEAKHLDRVSVASRAVRPLRRNPDKETGVPSRLSSDASFKQMTDSLSLIFWVFFLSTWLYINSHLIHRIILSFHTHSMNSISVKIYFCLWHCPQFSTLLDRVNLVISISQILARLGPEKANVFILDTIKFGGQPKSRYNQWNAKEKKRNKMPFSRNQGTEIWFCRFYFCRKQLSMESLLEIRISNRKESDAEVLVSITQDRDGKLLDSFGLSSSYVSKTVSKPATKFASQGFLSKREARLDSPVSSCEVNCYFDMFAKPMLKSNLSGPG